MTEDQANRVRDVMRRLLQEQYGGNRTRLGKALGLSQSAVSQLIGNPEKDSAPKNRPSDETARLVAQLAKLPDRFWLGKELGRGQPRRPASSPHELDAAREAARSLARMKEISIEEAWLRFYELPVAAYKGEPWTSASMLEWALKYDQDQASPKGVAELGEEPGAHNVPAARSRSKRSRAPTLEEASDLSGAVDKLFDDVSARESDLARRREQDQEDWSEDAGSASKLKRASKPSK